MRTLTRLQQAYAEPLAWPEAVLTVIMCLLFGTAIALALWRFDQWWTRR